jgi:hypothetical protein
MPKEKKIGKTNELNLNCTFARFNAFLNGWVWVSAPRPFVTPN